MPEININEAQKRAIQHGEGPVRVLAGPGSGKTFVIIHRLKYLIEQHQISPNQILVITFTKAAALEMQERFQREVQQTSAVSFCTFHSLFYNILRIYFPEYSNNILSESDKYKILQPIIVNFEKKYPYVLLPSNEDLLKEIGFYKNSGGKFSEQGIIINIEEEYFYEIYLSYVAAIECTGKLDFDDMATRCLHLFTMKPQILKEWQKKFQYIMIDEFQDINNLQYEVMKLLAGDDKNIFVVGDDDQSIYGFRGSNPLIMQQFSKDYVDCENIFLNVNYRCSCEIVGKAAKYIEQNQERVKKDITAYHTSGKEVIICQTEDREEGMSLLVRHIKEWKREDKSYGDIAIICRTNRENEMIAMKLKQEKIPYYMKEKKKSIFEHFIMRDFCTYLRIGLGDKTRRNFLRIMNRPNRYLGRQPLMEAEVDFTKWKERCLSNHQVFQNIIKLESDIKKIKNMSPYLQINYIRKGIGYDHYLKENSKKNLQKEDELMEIADFIQNSIKGYTNVNEWMKEIEEYKNELEQEHDHSGEKDSIHLLTMHGSKGLEFPCVIIPYNQKKGNEIEEEERRMLYVAMTRAKEELVIISNEKFL